MGKLGGREIGYGSDLDVVFVFDPDADIPDPVGHYSKCARKIISLIGTPHYEGPGYELDTRLRPSGSQGLLVTSIEAFARYHGTADAGVHQSGRAATWERLALLRARFVAGDTDLGQRAIAIAQRAAYEQQLDAPTVGADIKRLRERMEQELARERPGRYDLKFGRGGLLDIEFSVQLLQLRFGQSAAVRSSDTREALEGLRQIGALNEDKYRKLHDGYHFLRRVEQRLRIVHGDGAHLIEENAAGLFSLARRLGIHASPRHDAATL